MKFYQFTNDKSHLITHFHSKFFMNKVLRLNTESQINLMTLEEEGIIGFHQAVVPQLLVVLEGEGYVRSDSSSYTLIKKGEAVLWEKGEWHETKTNSGLIALVIESKEIDTTCILMAEVSL